MDLGKVLNIALVVVSVLLIGAVLLQQRGSGIGSMFGGGGGEVYRSKRGAEKFLFNMTVLLGVLLAAIAIALAILKS